MLLSIAWDFRPAYNMIPDIGHSGNVGMGRIPRSVLTTNFVSRPEHTKTLVPAILKLSSNFAFNFALKLLVDEKGHVCGY